MTKGQLFILILLMNCAAYCASKKDKPAYPPLIKSLAAGRAVFIVNQTPENTEHATKALMHWGRYKATPKSRADLLFRFSLFNQNSIQSLRKIDPEIEMLPWNGCCVPEYANARLAVYDLHTGALLYSSDEDELPRYKKHPWYWNYNRVAAGLLEGFRRWIEQ